MSFYFYKGKVVRLLSGGRRVEVLIDTGVGCSVKRIVHLRGLALDSYNTKPINDLCRRRWEGAIVYIKLFLADESVADVPYSRFEEAAVFKLKAPHYSLASDLIKGGFCNQDRVKELPVFLQESDMRLNFFGTCNG